MILPDYKMNTPVIAGNETLWYRTLRALYLANTPLRKKEWLDSAKIYYSDDDPLEIINGLGHTRTKWPYRHWRGLYPAMFKRFQLLKLVTYDCKVKMWSMNRLDYEIFCSSLNIEP